MTKPYMLNDEEVDILDEAFIEALSGDEAAATSRLLELNPSALNVAMDTALRFRRAVHRAIVGDSTEIRQ